MDPDTEQWQRARLIPVSGITGAAEQERRGTSALLAVIGSVKEFGRALTSRWGAPAGTIETYIEVPFDLGDAKHRPDGLIRIARGKKSWVALVEVKTGHSTLELSQLSAYVDIAREQGFDAVITISNEIPPAPGVHPVAVDKKKLKKVALHHMSWSQVRTEALIEQVNRSVVDPDQAWILSEFVRFLEYPKSGALDFDGMGPSWVSVREAVAGQILRATEPRTTEIAVRFDQLLAFTAMTLSQKLGVHVRQALSRAEMANAQLLLANQANELAKMGHLSGSLLVPGAAAPITILADLRANRIDASLTIAAPSGGRPGPKITWLLRQLKNSSEDLVIRADLARSRKPGISKTLGDLVKDQKSLLESPSDEIRSFTLTLSRKAGTKGGQGRGTFIDSVVKTTDSFYSETVQHLKNWVPTAPKVRDESDPEPSPTFGPSVVDDPSRNQDERERLGIQNGVPEPEVVNSSATVRNWFT